MILCAVTAVAAEPEVRVVRLRSEISPASANDLSAEATTLLLSCSVNSTRWAASESAWDAATFAPSFVHVRYQNPKTLQLAESSVAVDEFLIPLPNDGWPAHFFVRSGDAILAFTKYRPQALKKLVWGAPLELHAEPPYSGLANLPEE
jgi:hypothetical protein